MLSQPFEIIILITSSIAISYMLEARFQLARRIGAVMILITLGLLLANLGLVPHESAVYDHTFRYVIPISIALLLLRVRLVELKSIDRRMVLLFLIGAAGTCLGSLATFWFFGSRLGAEAWKLSAQLTASYIGGGENAVAIGTSLNISRDLFTAAFAADNIVTAAWMMIGLSAPFGLARLFSSEVSDRDIDSAKEHSAPFTSREFLPSLFYSLAIAGIIVIASQWIGDTIKATGILSWNTSIIWVTTFSLIAAQLPWHNRFKVSYLLGTVLFNYFFFVLGAISSIKEIIRLGPVVLVYVSTVVAIHGIILFGFGKLMKAPIGQLLIASQACIGGPSTAVALAEANDWPHLVVPGIILGVTGYAIGNYAGFLIALLLHGT